MTDDLTDYAADYYNMRDRDAKAEALRQRQLQDQQRFMQLQNRRDYVAPQGTVGTRMQATQRMPMQGVQRLPAGEQIVRNPSLLKRAIMPTPMKAVPQPKSVSTQPYAPKVKPYPMQKSPSILYAGGLQTGMPVKKWPISFKKAFHKPTQDETILKGLNNLDSMASSLLGKGRR